MENQTHIKAVSVSEAARCLRVSVTWLKGELEKGSLPGLWAGRSWLVHVPTVSAILTERAKSGEGGSHDDQER
jgi:hypothetical protein